MLVARRARFHLSAVDIGSMVLLFGCWLVGSLDNINKYFPRDPFALYALGAIAVGITLVWLRWWQRRCDGQIGWSWLAALWILAVVLYLILYPISQRHLLGIGSDSEDALRVATSRLLRHHYPYALQTYLGNPISPMPGALILAIPFELLGRVSLQNLFWLGAFIIFCARFFRLRSTVFAFILVLAFGSAGSLDSFVVGADYITIVWYLCVAVFLFLSSYEKNPAGWQHLVSGVLLGITLSSRPPYLLAIPPLLLAYLLQSGKGSKTAWRSFAVPFLVAAAVTLPFYLYDPARFSPLHVGEKLGFLPASAQHIVLVALPVLALLVASIGFLVRLTIRRVFLIAGIAIGIILLSPALLQAAMVRFAMPGWDLLEYSIPGTVLIGLWAFARFESASQGGRARQTDGQAMLINSEPV